MDFYLYQDLKTAAKGTYECLALISGRIRPAVKYHSIIL